MLQIYDNSGFFGEILAIISKKYPENQTFNVHFSEVLLQACTLLHRAKSSAGSRTDALVVAVEFALAPDFTYFSTDETQSLYRNEHSQFFYFETRTSPEAVARREWTQEWWKAKRNLYEIFSSDAVYGELLLTPEPKRSQCLEFSLVYTIPYSLQ